MPRPPAGSQEEDGISSLPNRHERNALPDLCDFYNISPIPLIMLVYILTFPVQ